MTGAASRPREVCRDKGRRTEVRRHLHDRFPPLVAAAGLSRYPKVSASMSTAAHNLENTQQASCASTLRGKSARV
jgi:hypothetical protein